MRKSVRLEARLGDLIRKFSMCFRLRPMYEDVVEHRLEVGCEVELIGHHFGTGRHVTGGCRHCIEVLLALIELHDFILFAQQSAEYLDPQCEKLIRYVSMAADWPEVVLDVKIVRPPLRRVSGSWVARLSTGLRTELMDLGCREIPFSCMLVASIPDNGFSDQQFRYEATGSRV